MTLFRRYIGIDYSGAGTPKASLKGLRVYLATAEESPSEVPPPPSPRKYWSRSEVAYWLRERLLENVPTIIGIDHAFSFPDKYFVKHELPRNWRTFLEDFHKHWPTDEDIFVDFVRDNIVGNGAARKGSSKWRRLTDVRARGAKSPFQFDVQGSVAKSTHSGLPWLLFLDRHCGKRVHFWPFDGWKIAEGKSTIVEVYPSLWKHQFPSQHHLTSDQQDAYTIAAWLRQADENGKLLEGFEPKLLQEERELAAYEGWILGVA